MLDKVTEFLGTHVAPDHAIGFEAAIPHESLMRFADGNRAHCDYERIRWNADDDFVRRWGFLGVTHAMLRRSIRARSQVPQ